MGRLKTYLPVSVLELKYNEYKHSIIWSTAVQCGEMPKKTVGNKNNFK